MAYSPINPSDQMFTKALYITDKPEVSTPGFEGSGTVVSSGGGLMSWWIQGKKVALCSNPASIHGCW